MRNTIHIYEKAMLKKTLASKTTLEVIEIIDRKISLIEQKGNDRTTLNYFLDGSIFILKDYREQHTNALQLSKIRVAICHFQSLKMHYKI